LVDAVKSLQFVQVVFIFQVSEEARSAREGNLKSDLCPQIARDNAEGEKPEAEE
jgi:hypothetical protein